MEDSFKLTFAPMQVADAIRAHRTSDLSEIVKKVGLMAVSPTLVLVGGASGLNSDYLQKLRSLFIEVLAPLVDRLGAVVVDGGTDAGVMQLIGQARAHTGTRFSLVGVAAVGTVILPDSDEPPPPDGAPLEPNHTHFVLVPGTLWGDEAPWIARIASAIAHDQPSATILINGGKITRQDAYNSIRNNRPVIVVAGSGRTADELAEAVRGEVVHEWASELIQSGLVRVIDLADGFESIARTLQECLSTPSSSIR
jgi:hypothetical protein